MSEVQITSQFIFDVWVEKSFKNKFLPPLKLTQIKINCPPSYYTAKMIVDEMVKDILNDENEIPTRDDEVVRMYARLGCFQ